MKQTKRILTIASALLITFGMAGCKHSTEEQQDTIDSQVLPVEEIQEEVPAVSWQPTVDEYLTNVIGRRLGLESVDVLIAPSYTVLAVDSSDANDYRVWGDWHVYAYDKYGDVLITSMAVCAPGLFHLKKTADGFEVNKFDEVEEGRAIDENAQRVFGKYCDAFWAVTENQEYNDSLRFATMAEYVRKNNLPFTKMQVDTDEPARAF